MTEWQLYAEPGRRLLVETSIDFALRSKTERICRSLLFSRKWAIFMRDELASTESPPQGKILSLPPRRY